MTDILCTWLNDEVHISRKIGKENQLIQCNNVIFNNELLFILDNQNFAKEFSNGFLIGEVLAKYDLCDDFSEYSQSR